MSANNFNELRKHIGHKIVCVCYKDEDDKVHNVAVECEDCMEVLLDHDSDID